MKGLRFHVYYTQISVTLGYGIVRCNCTRIEFSLKKKYECRWFFVTNYNYNRNGSKFPKWWKSAKNEYISLYIIFFSISIVAIIKIRLYQMKFFGPLTSVIAGFNCRLIFDKITWCYQRANTCFQLWNAIYHWTL